MPTVRPTCTELVEAVREFIQDDLLPIAEDHLAFNTRIAIGVLKIIERELTLGPAADETERQRLQDLLGRNGTREQLNRALCQQLREAARDEKDTPLIEHLRQTTMAKLSIDNPRYSAYQSAKQADCPS